MQLREDQIQRYSRQILLREVGGAGQKRLLSNGVRVTAHSPSLDVAIAYLVAGGTPVELAAGGSVGGFLAGASPLALNPDATAPSAGQIELTFPSCVADHGPQVVVGAGVAWRMTAGCASCWAAVAEALDHPDAPPVLVGGLAALITQRLVLGWSSPEGQIVWKGGVLGPTPLPRCSEHQNLPVITHT